MQVTMVLPAMEVMQDPLATMEPQVMPVISVLVVATAMEALVVQQVLEAQAVPQASSMG
jgi:hypothetical protein